MIAAIGGAARRNCVCLYGGRGDGRRDEIVGLFVRDAMAAVIVYVIICEHGTIKGAKLPLIFGIDSQSVAIPRRGGMRGI